MITIFYRSIEGEDDAAREVGARFLDPGNEARIAEDHAAGRYEMVATVDVEHLEAAWTATQNIDTSWTDAENVQAVSSQQRSSVVGDVFVSQDRRAFVVDVVGFKELSPDISAMFNQENQLKNAAQ